jgi:hypothetical protein
MVVFAVALTTYNPVISTEAMDSFTVRRAVERPPHFALAFAVALAFALAVVLASRYSEASASRL